MDANVDYRKNFKKAGRELGISMQYSGSQDNTDYSFLRYGISGTETRNETSLNIGKNNETTIQVDYTEPLHAKLTWEVGTKTTLRAVKSDYHFDSFNYLSQVFSSIEYRNNQFDYYQNVFGGYSQFTYNPNSRYSFKVGGRYEATEFGGVLYQPTVEKYTGKPYQNFIPYLNVNRKLGKGGYLRGTYTQRIQRPSLFYLNPYTNFSDPLNITTGNPRLSAEVSNNYELSTGNYGAKGGWGMNVFHRRINNAIETIRAVGDDKVYRTTYGNIGLNYTTGFDLNTNLKGKWKGNDWTINFNGGLGWVDIRSGMDTGILSGARNQGITYNAGVRSSMKLNKNWQIELWGRFNAPTFSLQGTATNWFFHMIGVKRRFHNDKGGIGFGLDNPFIPRTDFITKASGPDFSYYNLQRINMFGVRVNFDYKFGSMTIEKPKPVLRKLQNDDLKPAGGQEGM
jgi:outer membrane receptor protein involved in Fe transport